MNSGCQIPNFVRGRSPHEAEIPSCRSLRTKPQDVERMASEGSNPLGRRVHVLSVPANSNFQVQRETMDREVSLYLGPDRGTRLSSRAITVDHHLSLPISRRGDRTVRVVPSITRRVGRTPFRPCAPCEPPYFHGPLT